MPFRCRNGDYVFNVAGVLDFDDSSAEEICAVWKQTLVGVVDFQNDRRSFFHGLVVDYDVKGLHKDRV